jgi:hypothetical protein
MPSILKSKNICESHQWMSIATDGSCIKCVKCLEIRMLAHDDQSKVVTITK